MATPVNHWKLGLFVVLSVVLGLAVIVVLGARSLQKQLITYTTYFDESVQGLEIGSAVKFRGVIIGTVADIDIAPDRRHVRVDAALVVDDITSMGLAVGKGKDTQIRVPPELRTQLASMGITGVKFLLIDYFRVEDNPPPELPFPVPPLYVPAAQSSLKNIEDSLVAAFNRVPEVTEQAALVMTRVNSILGDIEARAMPAKAEGILLKSNAVLSRLDSTMAALKIAELSDQGLATLQNLNGAVTKLSGLLDRAGSEGGLFANADRASLAVGDAARNANGVGIQLEQTLRATQDAATAVQRLSDALERDSDMLLKGRARRSR